MSLVTSDSRAEALQYFRSQFSASAAHIHLNNAGQAPMCEPARKAVHHWTNQMAEWGDQSFLPMLNASEDARLNLARFLGSEPQEISFYTSAASAISQVAMGFPLRAGDEIIVWDQEYPSNFYPWLIAAKKAGAHLRMVASPSVGETPADTLAREITTKTRVIALSWVQYKAGAVTDLRALTDLARSRGVFTSADIIQGAGAIPFDFRASGLDAACGGSHKWMTGGHGAGFLILHQDHVELLEPRSVGAITFGMPETPLTMTPQLPLGPHRFEPGGKAFPQIIALGEAARLMSEVGIEVIANEARRLAAKLASGLKEMGFHLHSKNSLTSGSPIVNFSPGLALNPESTAALSRFFHDHRISFAIREPGVRLSPHALNSDKDIEFILSHLAELKLFASN